MGWDAYSEPVEIDWGNYKNPKLKNVYYKRIFENASKYVMRKAGAVDWLLKIGGLDVSTCGEMLEKATGRSVYNKNWRKDTVNKLNKEANWNFDFSEEDLWAYWSARKFLECCARLNLRIRFSW